MAPPKEGLEMEEVREVFGIGTVPHYSFHVLCAVRINLTTMGTTKGSQRVRRKVRCELACHAPHIFDAMRMFRVSERKEYHMAAETKGTRRIRIRHR